MSCILFKDRELIEAKDEKLISHYLKTIIKNGPGILPNRYVAVADADVFNKHPRDLQVFVSTSPIFVFVKPKTESSGGCESGCWRIMARDKLIKNQETGKILGFKKILRFREKTKPREYKRSWVMEEYRLAKKWNWRQDQVICKIRVVFDTQISSLLAKHFSCLDARPRSSSSRRLPAPAEAERSLPGSGVFLSDAEQEREDAIFLRIITNSDGNRWRNYYHLTNEVYRVHPSTLFDIRDQRSIAYGINLFVNRIDKTCGRTDGCDLGRWRIVRRDRLIKSPTTGKVLGIKRVYRFFESEEQIYVCNGREVNVTWTMEEYRLPMKAKQDKVLCNVKLCSPDALERLLRRNL